MRVFFLMAFAIGFVFLLVYSYVYKTGSRFDSEMQTHDKINHDLGVLRDRARSTLADSNALNALITATRSTDSFKRTAAIGFIGQVGSNAAPAVEALIDALRSPDPFAAREAANSLGEIGPAAEKAIPALIESMHQHEHADVGWFAAESLGRIARLSDLKSIEALSNGTKSTDERMRTSAEEGIQLLKSRH